MSSSTTEVSCSFPNKTIPKPEPATKITVKFAAPCGTHLTLADGLSLPAAARAYEIQRQRAVEHGQRWSDAHASAMWQLHHAYILTGAGLTTARTAWPLAVGTGKSESIVALVKAQHEEHMAGRRSLTVLVCMERLEQLTDLYRSIIGAGVPEDFVGVHHTATAKEVAAEDYVEPVAVDAASTYRVLLATHGKILKGAHNIAKVNTFEDAERDLVIWDESLIKSRGVSADLKSMTAANALFGVMASGNRDAEDAHAFFTERLKAMREAFEAGSSGPLVPPALSPEDELRFTAGVRAALSANGSQGSQYYRELLTDFLSHLQRPVRVLQYTNEGQRLGLIYFDTLIPPSLKRLVVLDASHSIRLLTSKHDTELTETPVDCAVKRFDSVTVKHLKVAAGRDALDKALPRGNSKLLREIVDEVRSWPSEDKGIIVTFRARGSELRRGKGSHADHIRYALEQAGVDVDGRVSFITWGQHTGVNTYSSAAHVLLVGVLRRDELELASAIAGQRGALDTPHVADLDEVKRVVLSEMFHHVVQAAGRGRCRHTKDGRAEPMTLSVICSEEFPHDWWQLAMPGVKVTTWHGEHATPMAQECEKLEALRAALIGLPSSVERVTASSLRHLAGLDAVAPYTYSRLLTKLTVDGWRRTGRSFERSYFPAA